MEEEQKETTKPLIDESLVLCGLCYETYNANDRKPLVLNCGHTYCKQCISMVKKSNQNNNCQCPTCKCPIKQASVDQISTNFFVINLLEQMRLTNNTLPQCPLHKKKRYELCCTTCKCPLCSLCVIGHDKSHNYAPYDQYEDYLNAINHFEQIKKANMQYIQDLSVKLEETNRQNLKELKKAVQMFEMIVEQNMKRNIEI